MSYDILIVGTGHAGAQAAIMLRQQGFAGTIALLGEEADPPYERPPLSKDYLAGDKPFERMLIRPAAFWAERDIALLTGRRVAAVDPVRRIVTLTNGAELGFGRMIWAGGGAPRRLACLGAESEGIFALRSRADADAIRARLDTVSRIAIVGGGYVGLEAAASLRKLGKNVILIESRERVLARVAGARLSSFFEAEHRAHGVEIRTGTQLVAIEAEDGRATGLRLADGELVAADMILAGIGIVPEIAPLAAAGAVISDGIEVDAFCRTSLPGIWAIGDCAAHPNIFAGGARIRLESVQNANDQAKVAVLDMLGQPQAYAALPWFWSNQYDLKLQTVGLSAGYDREILRGDPATRSFSVAYLREGRLLALDCVNAVRDYAQGRALVEKGAQVDPARLADPAVALKELLD